MGRLQNKSCQWEASVRVEPCIHVLVAYWVGWGGQNVPIDNHNNSSNSILWAKYSFNWKPLTAYSKKCKIHFLALVSPSVCFIFHPFDFVVLKKTIRVKENLPPTSSIYSKQVLGRIVKLRGGRETGFSKVRKKAQHTNWTGRYFPIFSYFKS